MKERVELNNNGRSIESHCKLFEKRKWEPRYIVCRLQSDLEDPLLTFYKNRKDRQRDKAKQSLLLGNYIGFEKSFPLKNKNQTLTVIAKDYNIVLSFHFPETLLQWETWFKNVGGQSTIHYMQLLKFPNQQENPSFINREVRCHLHDSRLALVYGIPAETLLYCEVSAASITPDHSTHRVTIVPHNGEGEFILCCPSIDFFARLLRKANEDDGSLNLYLNKKNAEGDWLHNIRIRKQQDSISDLSGTFTGWFHHMNPTSPSINQSEIFSSRAAINTIGIRNPGLKTPIGSLKFLNGLLPESSFSQQPMIIPPPEHFVMSPVKKVAEGVPSSPVLSSTNDNSPNLGSNAKQRSTSLPEYVNIQHVIKRSPDTARISHEIIQRKASTMTTPAQESPRFSNCEENRQFLPNRIRTKGRSMMDFSTLPYEENGNRHESWRKAKKFISAFSPKSHQDLFKSTTKSFKKSSSTSALAFSPIESKTSLATTSSSSELDELPPPSLNLAVSNPPPPLTPRKEKEPENIPAGLVRLREEGSLKMRGGVNIALARRLAAGINGSFLKYDGDRGTHVYPQTEEEKDRKIDAFIEERRRTASARKIESPVFSDDPIANVISKEREKLKHLERRASSVSFHRANAVQLAHLNEIQKKALASVNILPRKHSNSESQSIMSSSESLSSDARSKISIKKRSNSPPLTVAPSILPKQPSQQTLTLQKQSSSSIDSLNSQQTTRTTSSIRLPTRIVVNNSSSTEISSEESSGKSSHYFESNIGPNTNKTTLSPHPNQTLARHESRRMSEGQGSNSSDAMAQARKGRHERVVVTSETRILE
ncbi:unnamed protein product [Caenorhabditis sp. 36 PRJEB53466]|nr:unnamed protein product [Caenorhabditis sp. 36 PRJEB53466]